MTSFPPDIEVRCTNPLCQNAEAPRRVALSSPARGFVALPKLICLGCGLEASVRHVLNCPNDPPCPHPGIVHDIYDIGDERPVCCAEGCGCGQRGDQP